MKIDSDELRVLLVALLREQREHRGDLEKRKLCRSADGLTEKLVDTATRRGLRSLLVECRELAELVPAVGGRVQNAERPA